MSRIQQSNNCCPGRTAPPRTRREFLSTTAGGFGMLALAGIPGTAENVVFGEIDYQHPRGWYAAMDFIYIDDQFTNNANSAINESYTLANLRFGFERDAGSMVVSPFFGINNLFDETYNANVRINAFGGRFFEPGPDRNAYAGVSITYRH